MDIETTPNNSSAMAPSKKGQTPWGVLIAILLILIIVVCGAYYAFTERIAPAATPTGTASVTSY